MPFCGHNLEDEPPAYLNATRLEDVGVACRNAEVDVVDVDVRESEAPTIEKIKEFSSYFKVSCFGNLRLLHEAEIFREERLCAQIAISRRGIAEEPQRIGIIRDVRWIHGGPVIEREIR